MISDLGFNQSHALFRLLNANRKRFLTQEEISNYLWPKVPYGVKEQKHRVSCAVVRSNEWAESKHFPWRIGTAINVGYFLYYTDSTKQELVTPAPWDTSAKEDDDLTATQNNDDGPSWP